MTFIKSYPTLSALTLLLLSQSAFAAQECMFQDDYKIDLQFAEGSQVYDPSGWVVPTEGFVYVVRDIPVTPTHQVYSECNSGQDGQVLQTKAIAEVDLTKYYTENGQRYLMYPTTRPGLYYGVKIKNQVSSPSVCANATGYLPPNQSYIDLYDVGDDNEKACFDNDTAWGFYVSYFINSDFKHNPAEGDEGWGTDGSFTSKVVIDHGNFRLSGAAGDPKDRAVLINYIDVNGVLKTD